MDYAFAPTGNELEFMLDAAASAGALADGHLPGLASGVANESLYFAMALQRAGQPVRRSVVKHWTPAEVQFVRDNIHHVNDEQIAAALGRSQFAVKIYRQRHLKLPPTARHPEQMTLNQVALFLGRDGHSVMKWADMGMLPTRDTGVGKRERERAIRTVNRAYLKWWVLQPENWMLFKAERIEDPALRRLVLAKQARWGDEWISTGEVARIWGCDKRQINSYLHRGAFATKRRWGNWWVLRSESLAVTKRPATGQGCNLLLNWSPQQEAFVFLAMALGFGLPQMEQFGCWSAKQLRPRFLNLAKKGRIPGLLQQAGLDVQWRGSGKKLVLFADWRDYQDRFPGVVRAISAFKQGRAKAHHLDYVQAVLRGWARWYGLDELARSLTYAAWCGRARFHVRVNWLMNVWKQLQASGLEPL